MDNTSEFQKIADKIEARLIERGVKLVCPACNGENVILAGGFYGNPIQNNLDQVSLGGKGLPTIPIVCTNCGFVREFSVGVLGLLDLNKKRR